MIFESLYKSTQQGELLLIAGGYCRWHLCRNKQLTIYEIISTKLGAGSEMLDVLKRQPADNIFARCPADLPANEWYKRKGFMLENTETLKSGRKLNHWRLTLCNGQ